MDQIEYLKVLIDIQKGFNSDPEIEERITSACDSIESILGIDRKKNG